MKYIFKFLALVLLILFIGLNLFSCIHWGASPNYIKMKKQGYYPDTVDFPDTKWVCHEVDMCFNMLAYGDDCMVGEYVVNSTTYRVCAYIFLKRMSFEFYSSTKVSQRDNLSDNGDDFIECERIEAGFISTEYIYKDGVISCKIINSDCKIWNYEGDTITFENVGDIAEKPIAEWYCEELDMYLTEYSDNYFKGEIIVEGKVKYIHATEIGNGNYYMFSIENGNTTDSNGNTVSSVSPFVDMIFEYGENKIVAKVATDQTSDPSSYTLWNNDKTTFEFVEQPLSKSE